MVDLSVASRLMKHRFNASELRLFSCCKFCNNCLCFCLNGSDITQTLSAQSFPASPIDAASTLAKYATVGSVQRRCEFQTSQLMNVVTGYIYVAIDSKYLQAYTRGVV